MRNFDDWAFAMTFVVAVVLTAAVSRNERAAPTIAAIKPASAIVDSSESYRMVITGRRGASKCDNLDSDATDEMILKCAQIAGQGTTVTMTRRDGEVAVAP